MMTHREALEVVARHRGDRVVIATMGSVGVWPELSDGPLDFCYLPSSMGQAVPLGLGLALARPKRGVVVLCGDGGLLMNLGCLVTLADHPNAAVAVVLIDNGLYEVTGGQPVPGAGRVDYEALAMACGIPEVWACQRVETWEAAADEVFGWNGPALVWLKVEGRPGQKTPAAPRPMAEQIARLRQGLQAGDAAAG